VRGKAESLTRPDRSGDPDDLVDTARMTERGELRVAVLAVASAFAIGRTAPGRYFTVSLT
jgi:hypothetical protein